MFMANEPAFKLAVLEDVSLYNKAIDKYCYGYNSTLFATLDCSLYWKQDKANKNAIEIASKRDLMINSNLF